MKNDEWEIGGKTLKSRMLIGSALYPSPANMEEAIKESEAQIQLHFAVNQQVKVVVITFGTLLKSLILMFFPTQQGVTQLKRQLPQHRWQERFLEQIG